MLFLSLFDELPVVVDNTSRIASVLNGTLVQPDNFVAPAFDSVKIDRDYVTRFNRGGNASSLAVAVVQLSQSLGLPVVAEGVEDSVVADQLAALNCTTAQGRLYGDSMTGDQVRQFYASPDHAPAVAAGQ